MFDDAGEDFLDALTRGEPTTAFIAFASTSNF